MKEQTPSEVPGIGCIDGALSIFLVLVGLFWFITGQISLPYKGVFVDGAAARIGSGLWVAFWVLPYIVRRRKRKRTPPTPE